MAGPFPDLSPSVPYTPLHCLGISHSEFAIVIPSLWNQLSKERPNSCKMWSSLDVFQYSLHIHQCVLFEEWFLPQEKEAEQYSGCMYDSIKGYSLSSFLKIYLFYGCKGSICVHDFVPEEGIRFH